MGDRADAANPEIVPAQTEPAAGPRIIWDRAELFVWAGLLTVCLLTVPFVNRENLSDLSYVAVLNYAHQHGLQFGKDLVCSYGPLGFLIFPFYASARGATTLLAHLPLCFVILSGLCLAAWRLRRWARYAFLGVFAWAAANCDRLDTVAESGIFCWALLCFLESGRRLTCAALVLAVLGAFLALAKVSFLYEGTLTIFFVSAALV
ncbi:MAG TPA: hypothetical protein VLT36_06645, partial [Candidatus Dormibacteraeota bacterium]|nr:hypothetical protein [Candidatus Dormibacteraeota bacterium]